MFTEELRAARSAYATMITAFRDCAGPDAVALLAELASIQHLADGFTGQVSKVIEDTNVFVDHGDRSAAELCGRIRGVSIGDARRTIETTRRLGSLPEVDGAVRAGRLSAREAALISAVAIHDPTLQTELLAAAGNGLPPLRDACVRARARTEDPDARSARQHSERRLSMWTNTEGMLEGHFQFTPEIGGLFKAALHDQTQKNFRGRDRDRILEPNHAYAADALAQLVIGEPGVGKTRAGVTAHILIDHAALIRGNSRPGEMCEIPGTGPVNVLWVRDMLGEAVVNLVIKNGRDISTVAHLGRHIPAALRTALIAGGRECCIEGCTRREYLEIDHAEIDHADGGPTAFWNLQHLCSTDHKRKSNGWKLGPPNPVTGKRRLDPPGASRAA